MALDAGVVTARRLRYVRALALAFTLLNSVRVVAYLPTMLSIWRSGQSEQHSLLTWLVFMGANGTMALWLYEHNGGRIDRTVLTNMGNAVMCGATVVLVAWFRF